MSPRSKKEYIEAIFLRYKKAPYNERTIILDEFCATCGYHRKHAIRLLRRFRRFIKPKLRKRGRSPVYHRDLILKPLKQIWLAANLPCSKGQEFGSKLNYKLYFSAFEFFMLYSLSNGSVQPLMQADPYSLQVKSTAVVNLTVSAESRSALQAGQISKDLTALAISSMTLNFDTTPRAINVSPVLGDT